MANAAQVTAATARVAAGTANRDEAALVARAAKVASPAGRAATAAQATSGKK